MAKKETERSDSRVNIKVTSYRKREHDPDGVSAKYAIDGLVLRGVLSNDSTQEVRQVTFKSIISDEEKTIIEITDNG